VRAAETRVTFEQDIVPLLQQSGCGTVECHGASGGKGGFALSLFGAYPADDYDTIVHGGKGRWVSFVEPAQSLLLLKAAGVLKHDARAALGTNTAEYKVLVAWLEGGGAFTDPARPKPVSLLVSPNGGTLTKGSSLRLTVTAVYLDGAKAEVTRSARISITDTNVVSLAEGKLTARGYGQAHVIASFLRRTAVSRVVVPQPLTGGFSAPKANNRIDELSFAHLEKLGLPPSPVCTDEEFLRRAYLDVIGTLPTPEETRGFLADTNGQRRARLIDRLLAREEFADFWAVKWGDLLRIKSEYPVNLWPKAAMTYHRWVRDSIARNKPYDEFVRELLLSSGSNFRVGPANFYRAVTKKDAQTIGETAALVFMGARFGCARCHAHPTESWTLDDDLGLAAFFANVAYKGTGEWKEEIVYLDSKRVQRHPASRQPVKPRLPGAAGTLDLAKDEDPRIAFANWLTATNNPWFARNAANRVWFWLLGRGLVNEPDDLRPSNPAVNPELLDYLAGQLVSHGYDLKHLYRLVLNSTTYQLSSKTTALNAWDTSHFSHYQLKRLGAEQLLDAISQVTDSSESFLSAIPEPYTRLPRGFRAEQLFDGNVTSPFLELFGRPPRDTPFESERTAETSLWQALYFINSDQIEAKVNASARVKRLAQSQKNDSEIVEELCLAIVSRKPHDDEKQKLAEYLAQHKAARAQAIGDVAWAFLNSKEFIFNH